MVTYKNGNYTVLFDEKNGSKVRFNKLDNLTPEFPECCDLRLSSICTVGCNVCFVPGTKISCSNGNRNIEDVSVGSVVSSYNEETKQQEYCGVIETYKREYRRDIIVLTLDDGTDVKMTPNHRIYTNRGWVRADELLDTDEVLKFVQ